MRSQSHWFNVLQSGWSLGLPRMPGPYCSDAPAIHNSSPGYRFAASVKNPSDSRIREVICTISRTQWHTSRIVVRGASHPVWEMVRSVGWPLFIGSGMSLSCATEPIRSGLDRFKPHPLHQLRKTNYKESDNSVMHKFMCSGLFPAN
jgi:hypothetical protein